MKLAGFVDYFRKLNEIKLEAEILFLTNRVLSAKLTINEKDT